MNKININDYKLIGNYPPNRQAIDELWEQFNHDTYSTLVNLLLENKIDGFDNITRREKFLEELKVNMTSNNYVNAACYLMLLDRPEKVEEMDT
jgi:hypothetical protein